MGERFTGITDEVFDTDLPFHYKGFVFDIRIAALVNNGVKTGNYRPLIACDGQPISHNIERAPSVDEAHQAALKWIQSNFA